MIIVLNGVTMEIISLLHAYNKATRCLLHVTAGRTRAFERFFSVKKLGRSPRTSATSLTSSDSSSSLQAADDQDSEERSVLLSFGKHYRGVTGDSSSHPYVFNLPTEPNPARSTSAGGDLQKLAKPLPSFGYLLLWSSEGDQQRTLHSLEEEGEEEEDEVVGEEEEVVGEGEEEEGEKEEGQND